MQTRFLPVALIALLVGLAAGYLLKPVPAPMVHNMHSTMTGMTASLQGKEGAAFEQAFIEEMIVHHQGAVAMARLVLQKSQRPELVKLANDIIIAQTGEISLMQGWLATWYTEASHTGH